MDGNMEMNKRFKPPVGWFPRGGSPDAQDTAGAVPGSAVSGTTTTGAEQTATPTTTATATPGNTATPNVGDFEEMRKTLPAELQNNETIKNSKSFTSLAEQLVNSQKLIGSKVSIPKDGDEKGWNEFYGKLGRPETADKYTIPALPENSGLVRDEALEKRFLAKAHKAGYSDKQVGEALAFQRETEMEKVAVARQAIVDCNTQLKKEWGNNYEERVATVQRVVAEYSQQFPGLAEKLDKTGLGSDPDFVKFFFETTEGMAEGGNGANNKGKGGGGGVMSPTEAAAEVKNLMGNKEFCDKYYNARAVGHDDAINKINELNHLAAM